MSEPSLSDPLPRPLGVSGKLAQIFIGSPLTPLLLLAALAVGALALMALPREEEPQISVPLVDVLVRADGLKAPDAVELVTKPLEEIVKGVREVEHVYSQTEDDQVVVTARFFVGTDQDAAILRIHEEIRANFDRVPIGIPEPLIIGRGINDVAILVLTLTPRPGPAAARWDDGNLFELADELQAELIKVDDVGLNYLVGGRPGQIRVEPDPEKLSRYGITLNRLVEKIENANRSFQVGSLRGRDRSLPVVAGQTLQGVPDIGLLLLTSRDGRPVYVKDVAKIVVGKRPDDKRVWHMQPDGAGGLDIRPAVSLALAKRQGANAVTVAEEILERLDSIRGRLIPEEVEVLVVRNYGETADEKANELLSHLLSATAVIVVLISVFVGWREGAVVLVVIPATILLTFFTAWLLGYTVNRVSMFALIFSIGILVDDAIVVVENITRHWRQRGGENRVQAAIDAVAEVGNPTLIATFTIVAALLPMMFVSGLMGPYMSPIPANASAAMLFSYLMAVIVTPWLMVRLARWRPAQSTAVSQEATAPGGVLGRTYLLIAEPLLKRRRRALVFLMLVAAATVAVTWLFYSQDVTVKLLPFDNKSELQVVVDLPEGSSLEATERALFTAARRLSDLPELTHLQAYVGTSAPFSFNGLVRHYFLRNRAEQGDLQINLLTKDRRDRSSHSIALDVRQRLGSVDLPTGTAVKVVEVPPGPPVLSTLLAEVYGPDAQSRRDAARKIREIFESVDFIVDVDDSLGVPAERLRVMIDQENLEFYGVDEEALYDTLTALFSGVPVGYSHRGEYINPIEIVVRLPREDLYLSERILSTPVPGRLGEVELGDIVTLQRETASYPLFRRDGIFAVMVSGELAGQAEAPIYGMLAVQRALEEIDWAEGDKPAVRFHGQPADESAITLLWDGEWEVTFVTFRDMGLAFAVAIIAIYFLLVGQFRSFGLPLVILLPVPLTLIGIVLGHWLVGAHFTATSMIGFIALAGIVVRNSILLVDFISAQRRLGGPLRAALLEAGAVRFKPIALTAITTMAGAAFMLLDPIFQGLAVSLLFGLMSSTVLTVLVIPAVYLSVHGDGHSGRKTRADSG